MEWRSRVITVYFSNALFHQTADVEPIKILGAFQHSLIGLDIIKMPRGKDIFLLQHRLSFPLCIFYDVQIVGNPNMELIILNMTTFDASFGSLF